MQRQRGEKNEGEFALQSVASYVEIHVCLLFPFSATVKSKHQDYQLG